MRIRCMTPAILWPWPEQPELRKDDESHSAAQMRVLIMEDLTAWALEATNGFRERAAQRKESGSPSR